MLIKRLLDRELERRAGGGAAVAAALQDEPGHAVVDPEQLHVAAVGLHVRADRVERLNDPRLERHGIQVVNQQQARHSAVLGQLVEDRGPGLARVLDRGHDPAQAVAVHGDDCAHQILRELPGAVVRELVHRRRELLDPVQQLVGKRVDTHLS